jgi:hypothetical protein
VAAFATGPVSSAELALNASVLAEAGVSFMAPSAWHTDYERHSGEDVITFAWGAQAHLFTGTFDEHYIFHAVRQAMMAAAPSPVGTSVGANAGAVAAAACVGSLLGVIVGAVAMICFSRCSRRKAQPMLREHAQPKSDVSLEQCPARSSRSTLAARSQPSV